MTKVNLTKAPFFLSEQDINWVINTIEDMSIEEKIGQLFVNMGSSRDEGYLTEMVNKYHIGAVRYNPGTAAEVYEQNRILQEKSKIPLLIAANTEAGGNGACTDGTEIGLHVKVAATNDSKWAYEMGRVSGVEASSIGCNWSFAPIVDINYNWRNPIISNRSFSQNPDQVLEMGLAYMKGIQESGIMPAAKHFPGDGVDERDQHLSFSINSFSCEKWDNTFGKVYQGLIDAGIPSIMAGHIHLPAYEKYFSPELQDEDCLPATLSKPIITQLLREKMNFNGVVVTDASHMVAMTSSMKRSEVLPVSIAAGCDLFLFFNDPDEDFQYMMDGYKNGIITDERLEAALMRILGLKAKLGLHKKEKKEILPQREHALSQIGLPENKALFKEVADKAITLVKNKQDIFPILPEKYKRILLVDIKGVEGGFGKITAGSGPKPINILKSLLLEKGFEVELYKSPMDEILSLPDDEQVEIIRNEYAAKRPIYELISRYDLVINVANVNSSTGQRIIWQATK
ncbi:beta-hexosaminidase, partial [Testudinibacter sp. TR-2022]|uniref:glycoside hydrolase family 3 protein n=1 Tax=Testudinibacter sp. TR-2022 TaxID=2585029 RepID=UPI001118A3CD